MTRQCTLIFNHMRTRGPISQKMAADLYGIQRLGARIYDLKALGVPIVGVTVTGLNRFGDKTHWTEYSIDTRKA